MQSIKCVLCIWFVEAVMTRWWHLVVMFSKIFFNYSAFIRLSSIFFVFSNTSIHSSNNKHFPSFLQHNLRNEQCFSNILTWLPIKCFGNVSHSSIVMATLFLRRRFLYDSKNGIHSPVMNIWLDRCIKMYAVVEKSWIKITLTCRLRW